LFTTSGAIVFTDLRIPGSIPNHTDIGQTIMFHTAQMSLVEIGGFKNQSADSRCNEPAGAGGN
jgi:hypothetical protein